VGERVQHASGSYEEAKLEVAGRDLCDTNSLFSPHVYDRLTIIKYQDGIKSSISHIGENIILNPVISASVAIFTHKERGMEIGLYLMSNEP
jgi:hypothetical protein